MLESLEWSSLKPKSNFDSIDLRVVRHAAFQNLQCFECGARLARLKESTFFSSSDRTAANSRRTKKKKIKVRPAGFFSTRGQEDQSWWCAPKWCHHWRVFFYFYDSTDAPGVERLGAPVARPVLLEDEIADEKLNFQDILCDSLEGANKKVLAWWERNKAGLAISDFHEFEEGPFPDVYHPVFSLETYQLSTLVRNERVLVPLCCRRGNCVVDVVSVVASLLSLLLPVRSRLTGRRRASP
eukprot:4587439-Amphidinium_carterae.2